MRVSLTVRLLRVSALLLVGGAALGWLLASRGAWSALGSLRTAAAPATRSALPWDSLDFGAGGLPPAGTAYAMLYVQEQCVHCGPIAIQFDSLADELRLPYSFIASDNLPARAASYVRSLRLRQAIVHDRGSAFRKSLGISAVPALLVEDATGVRRIRFGSMSSHMLREMLSGARVR